MTFSEFIENFLGLIFPNVCELCFKETAYAKNGYVCEKCRSKVKKIDGIPCQICGLPNLSEESVIIQETKEKITCKQCVAETPFFDIARSFSFSKGTAYDAVKGFKYGRKKFFATWLGDLLTQTVLAHINPEEWDYVVPIPLHRKRQRERGFNQAEILGEILSKNTGIPLNNKLLSKETETQIQASLGWEARKVNMLGAFSANTIPEQSNIILIDDVMTTGATLNEAARVLKNAGAQKVAAFTICRTVDENRPVTSAT